MRTWRLPGIAVAVPFLVGTLASGLCAPRPLLAVALLGLALALGRSAGRTLAIAILALVLGWQRPDVSGALPAVIDPQRPIEVRARLERPWRPARFGWNGVVAIETVRQGAHVAVWPARLTVDLGSPPPPTRLCRFELKGHLRRAPGLANDPPLPPGRWRLKVKSSRLIHGTAECEDRSGSVDTLRRRIADLFERGGESRGIALARALVLGDASRLDREVLAGLRRLGLGHLLAVSGLHVGIAGWILWVSSAPLPLPARRLAPLLGAAGYLVLVGPRPSLLRAGVMVALAARSLAASRPPQSLNALAWALTGVLAHDPSAVDDLGFALTAAATGGIVAIGPVLERRWRWLARGPRRALAATVGAQLAALPWTFSRFHLFTPVTAPLNLVAVPWTGLTLTASFGWLAGAALGGSAAGGGSLLDALASPYDWPALLPPGRALISTSGRGWPAGLGVALGLGAALLAGSSARRVTGAALALTLLLLPRPGPGVEVVLLDVGQGEAILLRDGRHAALVDGGGWHRRDIAQTVLVPVLARFGVRRLDAVVITHPDLDHCRGLVEVSAFVPVNEVWSATGLDPGGCLSALRRRSDTRWRPLWRGRRAEVGAWRFDVLHPAALTRGDGNDRSLVLRAVAGGRSILLTGDLGGPGERRLLARAGPAELRADVLKVAHHGSASSTSVSFLRAVSPSLALVSAGRGNAYGHPAAVTLDRLERFRIRVLRTDRDGMIRLPWPPRPGSRAAPPSGLKEQARLPR